MSTLNFKWDLSRASVDLSVSLQEAVAAIIPQQLGVIRDVWVAAVSGVQLPGMDQQVNSPPYAAALQKQGVIDYPWGGKPLAGRVIVQDRAVVKIERGTEAWDMKCIANGRIKVLTVTGWVPIKDVQVDDLVLSHDGEFHRVAATMIEPMQEGDEVLEIHILGRKNYLLVTPNHPLLKNGEWVRADSILPGDRVACLGQPCLGCGKLARWFYEITTVEVAQVISRRVKKYSGNKLKYNLTVEDAGSFVAGGFVVHNSGLLSGPKARRGKKGQRYNIIPFFKNPKPGAFSPGRMSGMMVGTSPFRTVSDFSSATSWIYPARPGVEVVEAVTEYIRPLVASALKETILREWR